MEVLFGHLFSEPLLQLKNGPVNLLVGSVLHLELLGILGEGPLNLFHGEIDWEHLAANFIELALHLHIYTHVILHKLAHLLVGLRPVILQGFGDL